MVKKVVAVAAAAGGLVFAGAGLAATDAGEHGAAIDSPRVLSGNVIQAPVHTLTNVCGNTVDVDGLLDPAVGNACINR